MSLLLCLLSAVRQDYDARVDPEFVILGNDALIRCEIPSFVGDFVRVVGWADQEGNEFLEGSNNLGNFSLAFKGPATLT